MSQDNEKCVKCGKLCGYDDEKGYWPGGDLAICGQCKRNLKERFSAFFGLVGCSSESYGMTVEWSDMDKILSHIKRDEVWRVSYIVTDKDLYQRTRTIPVSVEVD